ncbi:hypothetical protein OROMI_015110 [Orobanche minor]
MTLRPAASASPADGIDSYHLCHRLPRSSAAAVSHCWIPRVTTIFISCEFQSMDLTAAAVLH